MPRTAEGWSDEPADCQVGCSQLRSAHSAKHVRRGRWLAMNWIVSVVHSNVIQEVSMSESNQTNHSSQPKRAQPVSRRRFLKAAGLTAGTLLLAACAPAAAPAPAAPAATEAPAAATGSEPTVTPAPAIDATAAPTTASAAEDGTPKSGGTFRMMDTGDWQSLDAAIAFGYVDWNTSYRLLYNRLYTYDKDLKLFPDLATEMPKISDDKLAYTIPLRQGVKFHDGSEMTADDVKFTFERMLDPDFANNAGMPFISNIKGAQDVIDKKTKELAGVKVVDPQTIEITLERPQSPFLAMLAVSTNGVVSKKAVEAAGKDFGTKVVIGTGPYKLAEWKQGEMVALERFDEYFGQKGYLDRIEILLNIQPETQVLRWEAGEVEWAVTVPPPEISRIRADPVLSKRAREYVSLVTDFLNIRNAPPTDDLKVRQAIAHAIDRDAIVAKLQSGKAINTLLAPGFPMMDPNFGSIYEYNPDKAKQLIAESKYAGQPDALKMKFWSFDKNVVDLIQADLQAIGIECEVLTGDFAAVRDRFDKGEIQMRWNGYGPDYLDPDNFVTDRFKCRPDPLPADFCDKALEEKLTQTQQLNLDDPQRTKLFGEIFDIAVNQQAWRVPVQQRGIFNVTQDYVRGDQLDPSIGLPDPSKIWLDK
jgi:ABC-type transport system substrate-binding protein